MGEGGSRLEAWQVHGGWFGDHPRNAHGEHVGVGGGRLSQRTSDRK